MSQTEKQTTYHSNTALCVAPRGKIFMPYIFGASCTAVFLWPRMNEWMNTRIYVAPVKQESSEAPAALLPNVSQKAPPDWFFSDIFRRRLGIFSPNFIRLLHVPLYPGLQIFIQLTTTLTKSWHIKRDHHRMLKMSILGRNARWVVAFNMA